MLLSIRHTSRYQYDGPILYAVQRLRLWPQSVGGQTVHRWDVKVEGAAPEVSYVDGFGNRTELVRHIREFQEIVITAEGVVETEDRAGVFGSVQGFAPIWLFERTTPLTTAGENIKELAQSLPRTPNGWRSCIKLMDTIHDRLTFQNGSTNVNTTAEDALAQGAGVCQDYAHIFIATARYLNIPARYVSRLPDGPETTEQTAGARLGRSTYRRARLGGIRRRPTTSCPNDATSASAAGWIIAMPRRSRGCAIGLATETLAVEVVSSSSLAGRRGNFVLLCGNPLRHLPQALHRAGPNMTYCVGMMLDRGLVLMSDTRTNSGVDNISVFRKMCTGAPGERIIALHDRGQPGHHAGGISQLEERNKAPGDGTTRCLSCRRCSRSRRAGRLLRETIGSDQTMNGRCTARAAGVHRLASSSPGRSRAWSRGCS